MYRTLNIAPENCSNCKLCELACSMKKERIFNPAKSRIHVAAYHEESLFLPMTCFQCDEPYCANICPTNAIRWNQDMSALKVDEDRCVGCKMCSLACPFGGVEIFEDRGKAAKCDLCDGDPECAKYCMYNAITYDYPNKQTVSKKAKYADKIKSAYEGTDLRTA